MIINPPSYWATRARMEHGLKYTKRSPLDAGIWSWDIVKYMCETTIACRTSTPLCFFRKQSRYMKATPLKLRGETKFQDRTFYLSIFSHLPSKISADVTGFVHLWAPSFNGGAQFVCEHWFWGHPFLGTVEADRSNQVKLNRNLQWCTPIRIPGRL